jgi:hypothetical protein
MENYTEAEEIACDYVDWIEVTLGRLQIWGSVNMVICLRV